MKKYNQKGQVMVFLTLAFALLIFFIGLASDGGRAYLLRADLLRTVDSASIAAASALNSGGLTGATNAACDAARMNGFTKCGNLTVTKVTVPDASGNPKDGVKVKGVDSTPTIFIAVGRFFGCGAVCNQINVSAESVAAAGGMVDLVMNLDDTVSMNNGGWIGPAKTGANTLVDALIPVSGTSTALLSVVPFRGCYNATGANNCIDSREYSTGMIASLGNNSTILHNAVNAIPLTVSGSGTNNCEGLYQSRIKLFQSGLARPTAQKFLVVLTDAASSYNSGMAGPYNVGACTPSAGGTANDKVNLSAYNVAQDIKNGTNVGVTGQLAGQTVKVFVIFYGSNGPARANCTPPASGATLFPTTALNLGRCFATDVGDMYFAPTPGDVAAAFQAIINRLPVMLLN